MKRRRTGSFTIDCDVAGVRRPKRFLTVPMLVDTNAASTWVPETVLRELGIQPVKELAFRLTDGRTLVRSIGFAFLRAGEFETVDEVVFAASGDPVCLGARTLGGFHARVDPRAERLIDGGPRLTALTSVST